MTSEKKIIANKVNGKLGGVKTPKGKAVSKLNAIKHGLLSKEILLIDEEKEDLIELGKRVRKSVEPVGEIEMILMDRIITNVWRLRRAMEVETAIMEWHKIEVYGNKWNFEKGQDHGIRKGLQNMLANDDIEKLLRYETVIERSIYRALHELERIQSARLGERTTLPIAVDIDVVGDGKELGSFGENETI